MPKGKKYSTLGATLLMVQDGTRDSKEQVEVPESVSSLNVRGHLTSEHRSLAQQVIQTNQSSNAGRQNRNRGNIEASRHANGVTTVFYSIPASLHVLLSKRNDSTRAIATTSPQQHQHVG